MAKSQAQTHSQEAKEKGGALSVMLANVFSLSLTLGPPLHPIIPNSRIRRNFCNRGLWPARQLKYNSWSINRRKKKKKIWSVPEITWCSKIWSWHKGTRRKVCANHCTPSKTLSFSWSLSPRSTCRRPKAEFGTRRVPSWDPGLPCSLPTVNVTQPSPILTKVSNKETNKEIPRLTWQLRRQFV